jgi:hypothetical protein
VGKSLASVNRELVVRSLNLDPAEVNLSGRNSPFGSMGGVRVPIPINKDFIPLNGQGAILDMQDGNHNPQWMGLESKSMQWMAYKVCAPLAAVIDRTAQADSNGRLEVVNTKGETVPNISKIPRLQRIMKLMRKPNPVQTETEFNSQLVVLCKIFGYVPVFAIRPYGLDTSYTKYFFALNPLYCTPVVNYDYDMREENESGPIKEWLVAIYGKSYTIPSSDIILIKDGMVDAEIQNNGLPLSKIVGLDMDISNICAAKEADNVLLKKKGPLGIFSYDAKPDMAGPMPMNPTDKDDLQRDLARYGLTWGQLQYVISKAPLKWNAMSFNLRDLMTKETARSGEDAIFNRFDYPAELMSGKNATYENRNSAGKFLYENNIIPFSLRRMASFDAYFELEDSGYRLIRDYDHLKILQEDIAKAGEAFKSLAEGVNIAWTSGMMTFNQVQEKLSMDTIPGMDIYYNEYIKKYPPPEQKTEKKPKEPKAEA